MHELALCQSVYAIADRAREGRPVEVVHLRIGMLRQVVPDTLVYCWHVLTRTTPLEGSRIEIDQVPVTLRCRDCGALTVVGDTLVLVCETCESGRTEVVGGEEFVLTALDIADSPPGSEDGDG